MLSMTMFVALIWMSCPIHQKCDALTLGIHNALSHVLWSIALCYIIFACVHNISGPINWFLSHPCWILLSKLSFGIYLLHPPIIFITMSTFAVVPHFSEISAILSFIGVLCLSICAAIPATLAFEMPIDTIFKSMRNSKNSSITSKSNWCENSKK